MTHAGSTQAARTREELKLVVELDSIDVRVKVQGNGDAKSQIPEDGGTSNSFAAFQGKSKEI